MKISFVIALVLLAGCAMVTDVAPTEGVMQVSGDVYEIFKTDYRGIFGGEESLIKGVVNEANEFAESKSKVALPISARVHRVGILADWAWFYYRFSLVDKDSKYATKKFTDLTIERDARLAPKFYKQRHLQDRTSIYEQIDRLNDLRTRGLITDEEYQREKSLLLN